MAQLPLESEEAQFSSATELIPGRPTLPKLREAAAGCTACPLHKTGTQTVFGEGLKKSRLMMVGEQPGDQEDKQGKPFVGPAGRILNKALERAEIDRKDVYVTNAVKHFKWQPKGKRRIHQTPTAEEARACLPWLEAELDQVAPEVLLCLGATAAKVLIGPYFRVTKDRGDFVETPYCQLTTGTVHPSSIVRLEDEERDAALADFVDDLIAVRHRLDGGG
jgi:uracil-DNA glycosylase family protein